MLCNEVAVLSQLVCLTNSHAQWTCKSAEQQIKCVLAKDQILAFMQAQQTALQQFTRNSVSSVLRQQTLGHNMLLKKKCIHMRCVLLLPGRSLVDHLSSHQTPGTPASGLSPG